MGDSGLVILRPAEWQGKRLPLVSVADLPDDVLHGEWIVILHSRDCDHCQEILPSLLASVPSTEDSSVPPVRFALVDVKPGEPIYPASRTIVSTTLPASHEWFVSPPVAIRIFDGQVMDVCENKDELNAFVHRSPISHLSPTRQRGTPIPVAWALAPDVSQRGPWASAQTVGMKLEPIGSRYNARGHA